MSEQNMTIQQVQQAAASNPLLQSIIAPYLQPGVQLQQQQAQVPLTQQEQATSQQSQATGQQEQQNLQAQNPGEQAQSQTEQVAALQKKAQIGLGNDLKNNKMTLPSAISKYTALGMSADDVFKQYLSESPWKLPHQSPTQLQAMGVTPDAIGKIGDNGSFADKWNTRNAVLGMRDLHGKWNQTSGLAKLGAFGIGIPTASGQGYDAQREFLGEHLSSLIPGASSAQSSVEGLMNTLPDVARISEIEPGAADQRFNSAEAGLLNVKGYSLGDLGLSGPAAPTSSGVKQRPNMKGGELLQNILNDASSDTKGAGTIVNDYLNSNNPVATTAQIAPGMVKGSVDQLANMIGLQGKNGQPVLDPNKSVLQGGINTSGLQLSPKEALDNLTKHPLNTALTALPFLTKGVGEAPTVEGATKTATEEAPKPEPITKPTSPSDLMTKLNPKGSSNAGFKLKANAIKTIDSNPTGGVNADNVAATIRGEIPTIKKAFSGVTSKDVNEIMQGVSDDFKGKMSGAEAEKVYNTIPDSYTATGHAKQDFNSAVNLVKRKALSNEIENAAPGAGWKEGVQLQGKAFKAEKGQPAKIIKNLPSNAVKAGLNIAGLGFLREFL